MLKISAVIPTRGDVELERIISEIESHPEISEIVIEKSSTPFGWYVGSQKAKNSIIYYQDDDCVTEIAELIENYEPGIIVNAMTPDHRKKYPGPQTLLGFGSLFDKSLLSILDGWEQDACFKRESVRVFATLIPHKTIFPPITILPCAYAENRLFRQKEHESMRLEIQKRINEYISAGNSQSA